MKSGSLILLIILSILELHANRTLYVDDFSNILCNATEETTLFDFCPRPEKLVIYGNTGQVIESFPIHENQKIDLNFLENGSYFAKLKGHSSIKKLIFLR